MSWARSIAASARTPGSRPAVRRLVHAVGVVQALLVPAALVVAGLIFALIGAGHDEPTVALRGSGQAVAGLALARRGRSRRPRPTGPDDRSDAPGRRPAPHGRPGACWRSCWPPRLGLLLVSRALDGPPAADRSPGWRPGSRRPSAARSTGRCTASASRPCRPRGSARSSTCSPARSTWSATGYRAELDGLWRWPVAGRPAAGAGPAAVLAADALPGRARRAGRPARARSLIRRGAAAVESADRAAAMQR